MPAEFGPSFIALMLASFSFTAGQNALAYRNPLMELLVLLARFLVLGSVAMWLLRHAILSFPWMRTSSVNLVATRVDSPSLWVVAHLDSKSQTIPMLVRVGSVVLFALMELLLIFSLATKMNEAAGVASVLCVIALIPLIFCFTRNKSNGALDNASGVAAVLLAAQRLPAAAGVLITSGEELGLAGARAFARARSDNGIALNCDTIDERGGFLIMRGWKSERSAGAIARAAAAKGIPLEIRSLIPGILADHVAFNQSGWDSCTLSKGNLATLRAVHTSGDRNTSIDGTAIAQAADILVAAAEELT